MGSNFYNDSSYQSGGQQDTSSWRAHYGVDPRIGRDLDNRNQQLQEEVQNHQAPRKWAPDPSKLRDWRGPMDDPNLNKVMQDLRTQGLPNVFGRRQPGSPQAYGQPGYTGLDQQGYAPPQNYQNGPMYNPNPQRYAPTPPQNYAPPQNFGPRNYATPQDLGPPQNYAPAQTFGPPQNYAPAQTFGPPQNYTSQNFRPPQTYAPQNYGPQNFGYPPSDQGSSNYNFNPQQGLILGPVGDYSQPANNQGGNYNFNPQQGIWLGPVGDYSQPPYMVPNNQYAPSPTFFRAAPPYVAPLSDQLPLLSAAPNLQRPIFTNAGDNKPWLPPSGFQKEHLRAGIETQRRSPL